MGPRTVCVPTRQSGRTMCNASDIGKNIQKDIESVAKKRLLLKVALIPP